MRVSVLGPLRCEDGPVEVVLASAKERLLLAALALSPGRVVGPDALIDALWGEEPPVSARKTLQTYVSNLRRRIGADVVVTEPSGYRLGVADDDVDVCRFRTLVRQAQAAAREGAADRARASLTEAVGLWRGEPFAEAASSSTLAAEAVRIREEFLSALEARVAADLEAGCHREVVGELEVLVREHPFRERLWAHLMVALYRSGRQADALASYQRARAVLSDELGLEPSAELRRLERAVLDHDPSLETPTTAGATPAVAPAVARPPVRYAVCADGIHVAYQVIGGGTRNMVAFPSEVLLPIDAVDDEPALAGFFERLASFSRVIRFDPRGVGFSDPVVASGPGTLEQWVQDALAVMDAAGAERTVVFAPASWSLTALVMAATHPERVQGLVVVNGTARMARDDEYPVGIPRHVLDHFLDVNFDPDAVERGFDFLQLAAPSVVQDQAFRRWWITAGHRGASPTAAQAIQRVSLHADVRDVLPLVHVPTLILHRRGAGVLRVGHGRYLAEHIPHARYVELPGDDDLFWVGDVSTMLDEIEEFVISASAQQRWTDRVLTTIVCSAIENPAAPAEAGDDRRREMIERCESMMARQLDRFGGRRVNIAGEGVVAMFDGPARAVTCACAIRDAATQFGLELRAGLHTGEVEVKDDNIDGVAVDVAARVQAAATPNQVFVSRTVVDLVAGSGLEFTDRGLFALDGVSGEWRLFSADA